MKPRYFIEDVTNYLYAVYPDFYTSWSVVTNNWDNPISWSEQGTKQVFESDTYDYREVHLYQVRPLYSTVKAHKRISTNSLAGTNPA